MQVSSSGNYQQYSQLNTNVSRETQAGIVEHKVQQEKIDAYKLGMENSNTDESKGTTKAYMDFSKDVQRSNNYNEFVDNGGKPSDLQNRPTTLQNSDLDRETQAGIAEFMVQQGKINAYKLGMENSNTDKNDETTQAYMDFAQDVQRSNNYNEFVDNGGNPSDLQNQPTPLQNENSVVSNNGYQANLSQVSSYTIGNSEFSQAIDNVKNFNEFAQNANKQNAINTYVANSA